MLCALLSTSNFIFGMKQQNIPVPIEKIIFKFKKKGNSLVELLTCSSNAMEVGQMPLEQTKEKRNPRDYKDGVLRLSHDLSLTLKLNDSPELYPLPLNNQAATYF